jgi:hypothetical protein
MALPLSADMARFIEKTGRHLLIHLSFQTLGRYLLEITNIGSIFSQRQNIFLLNSIT